MMAYLSSFYGTVREQRTAPPMEALIFVKPETVIKWYREGFRSELRLLGTMSRERSRRNIELNAPSLLRKLGSYKQATQSPLDGFQAFIFAQAPVRVREGKDFQSRAMEHLVLIERKGRLVRAGVANQIDAETVSVARRDEV